MNHVNRQIPPQAHTAMYNWHKFWSRKTWNVVAEYIKAYAKENDVVFDPFAGSGVVAMEALKYNRRVIICDLLPVATEIARLTILPVNTSALNSAFHRVEAKVKKRILNLYKTSCRKCHTLFPFTCAIWEHSRMIEIRYQKCPNCGDRKDGKTEPTHEDIALLENLQKARIKEWYPKNPLYYPDGQPFKEKQKYESLEDLFTKRNLQALAWLREAIDEEPNRDLRDFLKIGFTSMVHLCSRLLAVGRPGYRPFSGVGWNQQSYWYTPVYIEANVWEKFEGAINGHQGLVKAKDESNQYYKNVVFAKTFEDVINGNADIYIHTGSSLELMQKMGAGCVDYIFTDPPYDSSIQFGELSYLWNAWLKKDEHYLDYILVNEVIHNDKQHKDFGVYYGLLSNSFRKMFDVLKAGRYSSVTFHNPTFKVRNATIRAGIYAGFEFQKIHHQELARSSAKSLLQPFGSAQGDFYLRFYKPESEESITKPEEIDETRFETIVLEAAISLLAQRAEETPYTQIINFVDPVLAKHGYFSSLNTGLDVKKVLQKHLGNQFVLVKATIGKTAGELWWLKEPSKYLKYDIPLSERVEETVYRELLSKGRVKFTQVWDAVSTKFPNSLTSDSTSIMDALKIYARQITGGYWMLKPEYPARQSQHNEILALLAEVGRSHGYDIWIGKPEQSRYADGLAGDKKLSEYVTVKIKDIESIINPKIVSNIDLMWIEANKIVTSFEVEYSTSMTSALLRGSNIDSKVVKYLVIPEERDEQLNRKKKSPMFAERFDEDNWHILYFDAIRNSYKKLKSRKISIKSIVSKKGPRALRPNEISTRQTHLFRKTRPPKTR